MRLVVLALLVASAGLAPPVTQAVPEGQVRERAVQGVVAEVDGDRLIVEMDGDLLPHPGDGLEIQRFVNGVALLEIRGSWVVSTIDEGRIIATTEDPDSDRVEVGDLVTILTTDRGLVEPTDRVTPGGPASSSTGEPGTLVGVVVAVRDRTVLVDVMGNLLPRPGNPGELRDTVVDDIPFLPVHGDWSVGSVIHGSVSVTSPNAPLGRDGPAVGNQAVILSDDPVARPGPADDGPVGSIGARGSSIGRLIAPRLSEEELPAAVLSLSRRRDLGGIAEAAGLRDGDIVVAVDGRRIQLLELPLQGLALPRQLVDLGP